MTIRFRHFLAFLAATIATQASAQTITAKSDGVTVKIEPAAELSETARFDHDPTETRGSGQSDLNEASAKAKPRQMSLVPDGRDFTFILSPYVWVPTVTGDIGLGAQGFDFELDAGDLLDVFEFGGLIRGEVRHKSGWGLSADYVFADLGAGVDIVIGNVDADIDAKILELAVVRRIELSDNSLDLYAGIRRWDADLDIAIETFFFEDTIRTGDEWTDPIVGARYQHSLSPKWRLIGQGDIGGFGAGSEFSWNAAAGVSYATSDKASFQLVYRVLSVDRKSPGIGGGEQVDLNITIQGPLIGFAYRF